MKSQYKIFIQKNTQIVSVFRKLQTYSKKYYKYIDKYNLMV